jgi:DNA-binding helix-hairpin-helix protein with protein kinase domain
MQGTKLKDFIKEREEVFNKDTELKQYLVNFVGEQKELKEKDEVTVEMIVEVMAEEFPEFVLSVAEENFLRGYDQAISDFEFFKDISENDPPENIERKT